jgi:hypothetical protein
MNNNLMKLVPDSTMALAMLKAREIGVKMLSSDCEQILRVVLEEPEFMAGLAAAVKDARAMSDRLDEARRIDPKDLNTPIFTHPARSIHQPDLTASLQAENKRLLEALKETNEEIRSGIESNVELEAEHSVFARELTAKNDALISEIEGRK